MVSNNVRPLFKLNARDRVLELGSKTAVMGVVNVTPDSFSGDGRLAPGRLSSVDAHVRYALDLVKEGADIIDIGGESTRPGAAVVLSAEEIKRVVPVVAKLRKSSKVFISVDTAKLQVARLALEAGADIVNTVRPDALKRPFLEVVKKYKAALVVMHMRATPRTMQKQAVYGDLIGEIKAELSKSLEKCLSVGIKSDRIILDPGIGFAKTAAHNLEILKHLSRFQTFRLPILVGTSRKSFIGKVLTADVSHRLWGTAASVVVSVINGAHIVRVHDVKAMRQTVDMADAILNVPSSLENA